MCRACTRWTIGLRPGTHGQQIYSARKRLSGRSRSGQGKHGAETAGIGPHRGLKSAEKVLEEAVKGIETSGFVNYFGYQRTGQPPPPTTNSSECDEESAGETAGTRHPNESSSGGVGIRGSAMAWKIGRAIFQGQWEDAVDLVVGGAYFEALLDRHSGDHDSSGDWQKGGCLWHCPSERERVISWLRRQARVRSTLWLSRYSLATASATSSRSLFSTDKRQWNDAQERRCGSGGEEGAQAFPRSFTRPHRARGHLAIRRWLRRLCAGV